MKIGDKIAYIKYDVSDYSHYQQVGWGYIFFNEQGLIGCGKYGASPVYIKINSDTEKYFKVDDNTKDKMKKIITNEIDNLRVRIKLLTAEEKNELVKAEFNKIKGQITTLAKNMIANVEDESGYINRLKEICSLKTKLFTIKIENLDNVHKVNGGIKYKIKLLENMIEKIDNEKFE